MAKASDISLSLSAASDFFSRGKFSHIARKSLDGNASFSY